MVKLSIPVRERPERVRDGCIIDHPPGLLGASPSGASAKEGGPAYGVTGSVRTAMYEKLKHISSSDP